MDSIIVSDYSAYFANDETLMLFVFHEFIILWFISGERNHYCSIHPRDQTSLVTALFIPTQLILKSSFLTPLATAYGCDMLENCRDCSKDKDCTFFVRSDGSSVCSAKVVSGTSMRVTSESRCRAIQIKKRYINLDLIYIFPAVLAVGNSWHCTNLIRIKHSLGF
jgi:hypothetical protein